MNEFKVKNGLIVDLGGANITGSLIVSGANGGINTSLGFPILFQNDGVNTVTFGNGKLWLNDSVGGTSIDWGNRYLLDTSGTTKADWEQNYLVDGNAITRVDWGNGALNDSAGTAAFDWESRRMIDVAGARSADFDTRFLIYPNGTTAAINYGTQGQIAMTGSVSITGSLTVSGSSTFTNIGPAIFTGSVSSLNGFTGSLLGTASYATVAQTLLGSVTSASFASTASFINPLRQNVTITGSLVATGSITASAFNFVSSSLTQSRVLLDSNGFTDLNISGLTPDVRARSPLLRIYGTYTTGSANTTGQNHILVAHLYPTFNPTNNSTSVFNTLTLEPQFLNANATGSARGLLITPGFAGSHPNWRSVEWDNTEGYGLYGTGTARNYLNGALGIGTLTPSASFHTTGNGIIVGSLVIGTSSLGSTENTLVVGPSPSGGTGEGGQILLQASGGLYTTASMIDNYQNKFRVLRGTNASSDAFKMQIDMHSGQVQMPNYNSKTAFTGSAVAALGADSGGTLITISPILSIQDVTDGTAVTGTTSGTLTKSILIPANTVGVGDVLYIKARARKTGTAGTLVVRMYINTSAAIGGSLIATSATNAATTVYHQYARTAVVKTTTNTETMAGNFNVNADDNNVSSAAVSANNIDWTVNQYLVIVHTNASTADSSVNSFGHIQINKA